MRIWISLLLFILSLPVMAARLSGYISDREGNPLPFASIYIQGTTIGTASNPEGYYELELPAGDHMLVYQYVGYKRHYEQIVLTGNPLKLDVMLEKEEITLDEVVIAADAEDPAYRIIRNAIRMRKYYLGQVNDYKCQAYTKGIIRITEAPDKMFGDSLNTKTDSILGIVYLSESESIISFEQPDQFKEEMVSAKVSGNDQDIGFNFISFFMVNFYNNNIKVPIDDSQRGFISPVASSALFYYHYHLEGSYYEDGHLVHKIRVIPKRKIDPVFSGYIYIMEDSWRINSLDLVLGKDANISFIDSIHVSQSMVPLNDTLWMMLTQRQQFFFSINIFGKRFAGNGIFHSQFTDYIFNNEFTRKYFGNELIKASENANNKDSLYWEQNRPIPLTDEERRNYHKEDSLQKIRNSKEYLDSLDRKSNKFRWGNLLGDYTYYRRHDSTSYTISSPLTTLNFNTVQGLNLYLETGFSKTFRNRNTLRINQNVSYGFSNYRWGYSLGGSYMYKRSNFSSISFSAGIKPMQFNGGEPISPFVNTLYTLLDGHNFLKIYEKRWISFHHNIELTNGVFLNTGIEYARRSPLVNTIDYTWVKSSNNRFTSNDPLDPLNESPAFADNDALRISVTLRFRIKQKYLSLPHKTIIGSKYPDLVITYIKGIKGILGSDVDFDVLKFSVEGKQRLGLLGTLQYRG
ncbi:MAG TPA: DUF5686 and carboxypeptidase regulatory-like domain-containing protein, partial [Bacteroidales bacterium]|nr:DUF5686 and carboxypeptidase regulatory-like domain-containing protein [Bacteroidales bacterium]